MTRSTWRERDVPDLGGTRAIVTGASSGIGLEASRILAGAGAEVVLAVRDPERGQRAAEEIGRTVPRRASRWPRSTWPTSALSAGPRSARLRSRAASTCW